MRVLMTADPLGGVWTYALELSAALGRQGIPVELATLGAPLNRSQRAQVAALPGVGLHEGRYRLEWMQDPWDDLRAAGDWLLAIQAAWRCTVIHLNHLVHGDLPWGAPAIVVGHSCVLSWWRAVRRTPLPLQWQTYRQRVRRSLEAASCIVAPTRAMLTELEHHYGPFLRKQVIPNGRSGPGISQQEKEAFILCAGRLWDEGKNVAALAGVAPCIEWPVYVAGAPAGPDGSAVSLSGLHQLGPLDPDVLARWYARAAIYALPACYEPFGLSVLEAAQNGCALVLGDLASLRELWQEAAIYVPPGDHGALRAALAGLIADPARIRSLGGLARVHARKYSPARMLHAYRALYRQLEEESFPRQVAVGR